jgi:hypothetical protein
MQVAARKVLWENQRLRDLLVAKGVKLEEISAYLKDHESIQPIAVNTKVEARPAIIVAMEEQGTPEDQNSMSCENAASIIASMRGHSEDEETVRKKLGCASLQTCKVKNVEVLQVMEME